MKYKDFLSNYKSKGNKTFECDKACSVSVNTFIKFSRSFWKRFSWNYRKRKNKNLIYSQFDQFLYGRFFPIFHLKWFSKRFFILFKQVVRRFPKKHKKIFFRASKVKRHFLQDTNETLRRFFNWSLRLLNFFFNFLN